MDSSHALSQKLLLIGGTASMSNDIVKIALERGYEVTATFRTKTNDLNLNVNWVELDVANQTSIENFNFHIGNRKFDLIIYLIGELSLSEPNKEKYLHTHLNNTLFLIENLKNNLDIKKKATLLFMSSRAAIYPSFDLYYSIVKAGLAAAIRSLSLKILQNQRMFSLAPGLVIGSTMYQNMPKAVKRAHHMRSDNNLLNTKALASEIFRIIDNQEIFENGSLIEVGPKYK